MSHDGPGADRIDALAAEAREALQAADDPDRLEQAVRAHLGRRSALADAQRGLGDLEPERRKEVGRAINAARDELEQLADRLRERLGEQARRARLAAEQVDVTLPARLPPTGGLHPVRETMEAILDVLVSLGFTAVEGPEVESDWHNFEALNFPADHPARAMQDTIFVGAPDVDGRPPGTLLRTHTSPVQVRALAGAQPPVYVTAPGKVYRSDTPDATHLPMFHQVEGLAVDHDLSFADLRGTLAAFMRKLLGEDVAIRLRPSFFPFTEPSAEVDCWYRGGWMEMLGAGMVDPAVLTACGHDPERVQGFAFGLGVERFAMLRHGVTDLRVLVDNDVRFLASV